MLFCFYSYSESCTLSTVPEPILTSPLHVADDKVCLAVVDQPNLEVSQYTAQNMGMPKSNISVKLPDLLHDCSRNRCRNEFTPN